MNEVMQLNVRGVHAQVVDAEEALWRAAVCTRHSRAYQDYLGHIWTDDFYNCDNHCLSHIDTVEDYSLAIRGRFRANWKVAAGRVS